MKRGAERFPAAMLSVLWGSEISLLRSPFVEMTGEGISVSLIVWNLQISSFKNGGRSREALAFFGSILYNETIKLM